MDTKLILLLIILLINPVSAKFICGEVVSSDNVAPSWYEVKTYLATTEAYFSTCQVSPSNNRYCCDLDIIKDDTGYQWKSGDTFSVKITDKNSGYFATPKNLIITGQGYDIAPILTLKKAILITQPKSILTISKIPIQVKTNISSSCVQISSVKNLSFGENNVTVQAVCNNETFTENKTFYQVQNMTFQKYSPKKIRNKKTITIKLTGTLSHDIKNIPLKEYVPASWKILNISNNGRVEKSTFQYNVIVWKVNGNNFDFNYKVKAPKIKFWPEEFIFKDMLDEENLGENKIRVYKFFPLPVKPIIYLGGYVFIPKKFSKVSEEFPLIFKDESLTAVLYSSVPVEKGYLNLLGFIYNGKLDRRYDYLKSYHVQTTLNSTESGKIIMEYKTNKTFLEKNGYKKILFFKKQGKEFIKITGSVVSFKGDEIQYRFESEKSPSEIYIFAEKKSLTILDKILNFWDKITDW